jgi:hypothetical protein
MRANMTDAPRLIRMRATEASLLARRTGPADPASAAVEALGVACHAPVPDDLQAVALAIAGAVEAHGAGFAEGHEPAYHNRHHQAEATLAAGWLAAEACQAGLLDRRHAGLCVLALLGHDLLHDGNAMAPPGTLEQRAATATASFTGALPPAERDEVTRLILLTDPAMPPPLDLAGQIVREADLFGSLLPCLGWQLSMALARESAVTGLPGAAHIATHEGRLSLLAKLPPMTPAAITLGLEAARSLQHAAIARAGAAETPEQGAALLDALPREAGLASWRAALAALGLPALPR